MTGAAVRRRPEDVLWFDGPAAYLRLGDGGPWLRGVALGAVGRYADAARVLRPLRTSAALSALASHARQVGRHEEAAGLDARALRLAATSDERADAAVGLVADAVGVGDAAAAATCLAVAADLVSAVGEPAWRARTRLAWVRAELALLNGAPGDAVRAADTARGEATAAGARRHVAKSLLMRGVAQSTCGDRERAVADLLAALDQAQALGLVPLVWPAALVAARLLPDRAAGLRATAAEAARRVAGGLEERADEFVARPEIADLLAR